MNRLADLRPNLNSVDEARALMADLARLTCVIEVSKAKLELKLAEDKATFAERIAEPHGELVQLEEVLRTFILTHKALFLKPRKVATEFGSFGLQEASEVVITDEPALLDYLVKSEMSDCFQMGIKPLKTGIKTRLEAGETIPGCCLKTGDTAVYKVAKSIIEHEVEKALPERKGKTL